MTRVFALRTFLWIFVCVDSISGQESKCCTKVTGSCRSACEKLSLASAASNSEYREQRLLDVHNFCSHLLVPFWQCINQTLDEISKGEGWSGRACCGLPQSERCQQACITASGRRDLAHNCRQSDELAFFTCLDKQQVGDECCASAQSDDCKVACRSVFRSQLAPNRNAKTALMHACGATSPRTMNCVNNYTRSAPVSNPLKFMHCCDQTTNVECQTSCRRVLHDSSTDQEIIDGLQEGGCGPPVFHEKIWQCFLQGKSDGEGGDTAPMGSSLIDRMGMDSAKLHCCHTAKSSSCRKLCLKTFSTDLAHSHDEFNSQCLFQLSEHSLKDCLDEVEEPCELGCDGLSYCTNFNNRPTELFRSCSVQADQAAREDVDQWKQRGALALLTLPGTEIPIRNISQCSPLVWKAVACTLQIKPCHRTSHTNRICRQDCFNLLSQCIDWSRMPADTSAAAICSRLSLENPNTPCVSLEPFLEPSDQPYSPPRDHVTQPCKGEPCAAGQVCQVNRYCPPFTPRNCLPYTCSTGCKLGEVSQYIVPVGSYVRIPISSGNKGCLKICQCSADAAIENCQPMPCFPLDACWISNNRQEHGTSFYIECNFCSCYAGELTCTKKQCDMSHVGLRDVAFTSLPCNCPPHHVPVCGRNGRTYPSACLAKCTGLNDADFEFGSCEEKDPCAGNPCGEGKACVPDKRVCLSLLHSPCPQNQCVDLGEACSKQESSPVCDTEGHQHPNSCYLSRYGKSLAYHGPCLIGCNGTGPVCGADGNTYSSQCAATARSVLVDYPGPCMAVGMIETQAKAQCGPPVQCAPLALDGCLGTTPPGACCPVCAGAIRVLYSQKQVDRALYALKSSQAVSELTLDTVLRALSRHVTVAECAVRGHLTVELDLMVLVVPVRPEPSPLQLQACVSEAEKLASLVRLASPKLVAELSLGTLTAARVVHNIVDSGARAAASAPTFTLASALFLLLRWAS